MSGLSLKPLYQACDVSGLTHLHSLPGKPPFVRGPYASMYTDKPWTLRQYTGFAGAEACNRRLKQNLTEGGQGLSLAFDLPTHLGYDSSDPLAAADVGKAGVAIDDVDDMRELLAGIDLSQVSVSMTMNGAVLPVLACFIIAAEHSGVAPAQLRGTLQNDILKEFMVRNTYIFAPAPSLRISVDIIEYLAKAMPAFNPISVSGYHLHEAGADVTRELALTLANARTYAEHVKARGLDVQAFCARVSFFFAVGSDFFSEIAKLRAARLLWSEICTGLGVACDQQRGLRMHCQTSGWSLRAQDPLDNVVRTTLQALSAVFGGTQSLHTNAWDEALSLPTENSARLARNTQKILQQETGLCEVIDPWAGSYMMESLTAQLAGQVRLHLARIDAQGGVLAAIESGRISREIHAQATATQARIDTVQPTANNTAARIDTPTEAPIDSAALRTRQTARLEQQRRTRDNRQVQQCLDALTECARSSGNLLAATLEAVRAKATVGECTQALEKVWPRHAQPLDFVAGHYRPDEPRWHAALNRVSQWQREQQRAPVIVLGKLGLDGHDRGIRMLASALTGAGFKVHLLPLLQSPERFAAALGDFVQIDLIGISSLAGAHLELLAALLPLLQAKGCRAPLVMGGIITPADCHALRAMRVRALFGPGTPVSSVIEGLMDCLTEQPATLQPAPSTAAVPPAGP